MVSRGSMAYTTMVLWDAPCSHLIPFPLSRQIILTIAKLWVITTSHYTHSSLRYFPIGGKSAIHSIVLIAIVGISLLAIHNLFTRADGLLGQVFVVRQQLVWWQKLGTWLGVDCRCLLTESTQLNLLVNSVMLVFYLFYKPLPLLNSGLILPYILAIIEVQWLVV